jgi:hypothetical protein
VENETTQRSCPRNKTDKMNEKDLSELTTSRVPKLFSAGEHVSKLRQLLNKQAMNPLSEVSDQEVLSLDKFTLTETYEELMAEAQFYAAKDPNFGNVIDEHMSQFAGAVVERFGIDYFSSCLKPGWILLDKKSTFDFFHQALYPQQPIEHNQYQGRGIKNTVVPDALLVRQYETEPVIASIIEITATNDPNYFESKYRSFTYLKQRFSIFSSANILFVGLKRPKPYMVKGPDVYSVQLPVRPVELQFFVQSAFKNFPGANFAFNVSD